jgi:hypothetical protein
MTDPKVRDLLDEFQQLQNERVNFEKVWEEIAQHVVPNLSGFLNEPIPGEKHDELIVEGTPMAALQTYKAGLMGRLLSQYFNWFSIRTPDEDSMDNREVRMWLSKVDQAIYALIARSNFYPQIFQLFGHGGSVGTATIYREWDPLNQREVFLTQHPRSIYLQQSDKQDVDTVFRVEMMNHKNMVAAFDKDDLDEEVRKLSTDSNQRYSTVKVLHIVKPNPKYNPEKKDSKAKRFLSYYLDVDHENIIREGGYRIMPYCSWRVEKEPHEDYGRGPGWRALADIKALYAYAKTDITAAQMMVNPPLQIPEELRGKVRWVPGGRNYYEDANRVVHEGVVQRQLQAGLEREQQKQRIIEKHFMVPFFTMLQQVAEIDKGDKTAYEIRRIEEEMAILLGPHITGLNQDVMDKLIDGMFNDAWDAGMIPPPPRILLESPVGRRLEVDYMGPLAQAQRSFYHSEPYRKTMSDLAGIMAFDPSGQTTQRVLQNYNFDMFFRNMSKTNGLPEETMYSEQELAQIRKMIQQQIEQQQKAVLLEQAGKANVGLSKGPEPGSPAEALNEAS